MDFHLSSYYPILLLLGLVVGLGVVIPLSAHILAATRKRTPVKEMPYESGMDPIGSARQKFDVKFYVIAILFLVFDVELLFLYPWAVSAYRLEGAAAGLRNPIFWELLVFLVTLAVAFLYAWRKGVFKWR
jgi:NADH:ubiquinone oxidoreductase subunit 3 (subunit A)